MADLPTAPAIRALRAATGCSWAEAHTALTEAHGDHQRAVEWLRRTMRCAKTSTLKES